jgi:plasmid stabilization system protein ParE
LKYSFHPAAEAELNEAVDYYDECQKGLGQEFLKEIYRAVQNILTFPYAWSPLSVSTRRCLSKRFPYGVVYLVVSDDEVLIPEK